MTTLREFLLLPYDKPNLRRGELAIIVRRARESIKAGEAERKRLASGIEYRKKHDKAHLLPKWESDLDTVIASIETAVADQQIAQNELDQIADDERTLRRYILEITYRTIRDDLVRDMGQADDLIIKVDAGYTAFEVQLWSGEYRYWHATDCLLSPGEYIGKGREGIASTDCEAQSMQDPRFGFDATVYRPQEDFGSWRDSRITDVEDPKINWGTIGSQSPEDALLLIKVHTWATYLAIRLRDALDQPLPQAAQDVLDGRKD